MYSNLLHLYVYESIESAGGKIINIKQNVLQKSTYSAKVEVPDQQMECNVINM